MLTALFIPPLRWMLAMLESFDSSLLDLDGDDGVVVPLRGEPTAVTDET